MQCHSFFLINTRKDFLNIVVILVLTIKHCFYFKLKFVLFFAPSEFHVKNWTRCRMFFCWADTFLMLFYDLFATVADSSCGPGRNIIKIYQQQNGSLRNSCHILITTFMPWIKWSSDPPSNINIPWLLINSSFSLSAETFFFGLGIKEAKLSVFFYCRHQKIIIIICTRRVFL